MKSLTWTEDGLTQTRYINFGKKELVNVINNAITISTSRIHIVSLSSTNVHTIYGGEEGSILIIQSSSVILDNIGNLRLASDFKPASINDILILMKDGGNWLEIGRSINR